MSDEVNHPSHYTAGKVEIIEIIEQIVKVYAAYPEMGYCVGQVIKYLARAPLKGRLLTDLQKAQWYTNRAVDHATKENVVVRGDDLGDDRLHGGTSGPATILPFIRDNGEPEAEPSH